MLNPTSRILIKRYSNLFEYFNEVLNGTPNPYSVDMLRQNPDLIKHDFITVQLKKDYRRHDVKPVRLLVHKQVLLEKPCYCCLSVGFKTAGNGKDYWTITLTPSMPFMFKAGFERHELTVELDNNEERKIHLLAGGDLSPVGKPAATIATIVAP